MTVCQTTAAAIIAEICDRVIDPTLKFNVKNGFIFVKEDEIAMLDLLKECGYNKPVHTTFAGLSTYKVKMVHYSTAADRLKDQDCTALVPIDSVLGVWHRNVRLTVLCA